MGVLRGELGLATIQADLLQSVTLTGNCIYRGSADVAMGFCFHVDSAGKVHGQYGNRGGGQHVIGTMTEDQCELQVGRYIVGERITIRKIGDRIDGQVRGYIRSWDIHCLIEGDRIRGQYGSGIRRQTINVEMVGVPPLLVVGVLGVACHHYTIDYQSAAEN